MQKSILSVFLLTFAQIVFAQKNLPVIKASSKIVDIRDGMHFKKGYWYIMPEKKPDYYFAEIPYKEHEVTFITDSDSISFTIKAGEEYDFIILLNNKDSCYTRIAARYKKIVSYTGNQSFAHDTIPFTIGNNSKIYFKGQINNSGPLNIQFDLGSGGCIIKKSSVKKVNMDFDNSITLTNSDGTNAVPFSSSNTLQIANLKWDSVGFAVADNMTYREDLIVGNNLFQNKVVEINYDKKIVVIHDTLPLPDPGYSRHDMILDGVLPFLQGSLTINSKTTAGWFMFDTGAYTTILRTNGVSGAHKMYVEARKMIGLSSKKAGTLSPHLTIGNYTFAGFNYTVEKSGGDSAQPGILGNDLLKRFNVLLDNKNGYIYLKQNSLVNEPYANPEYYVVRVAAIVLILVTMLLVFILYKKRRRKKTNHSI